VESKNWESEDVIKRIRYLEALATALEDDGLVQMIINENCGGHSFTILAANRCLQFYRAAVRARAAERTKKP
jgi:hypothetical protein